MKQALNTKDQDMRELGNGVSSLRHEKETLLKDLATLEQHYNDNKLKHAEQKTKHKLHKENFDKV